MPRNEDSCVAAWSEDSETRLPRRKAPRKPEREVLPPRSGPWKMTLWVLWRVGKQCTRTQPETFKK